MQGPDSLLLRAADLLNEAEREYRSFDGFDNDAIYRIPPLPFMRAQLLTEQAHALIALATALMVNRATL